MDEDPLALENVRLRDQLRKDADALKDLRLELDEYRREREELDRQLDELRREREDERQQAEAKLNEARQRAEAAENRVAEFEAQSGEGILERLRDLCEAVQRTVSRAVPPRLWGLTFGRLSSWPRTR
jgi:chromosome segregation ATPase